MKKQSLTYEAVENYVEMRIKEPGKPEYRNWIIEVNPDNAASFALAKALAEMVNEMSLEFEKKGEQE